MIKYKDLKAGSKYFEPANHYQINEVTITGIKPNGLGYMCEHIHFNGEVCTGSVGGNFGANDILILFVDKEKCKDYMKAKAVNLIDKFN